MKNGSEIYFLVYQSRSGSTYLSKLLNQNNYVSVTPEADFNYSFIYKNRILKNKNEISAVIDEFFKSKKSKSWNFSKKELGEELLKLDYPITFSDFFYTILDLHYKENRPKNIVFKGVFPNKIPHIKRQFTESKFILISRDFRAVYNSQVNTINFNTGRPMSKNPFLASLEYRLLNNFIDTYKEKSFFHHVTYEKLIFDHENILSKIYLFMKVENAADLNQDYILSLSKEHKNIHSNVNKPPQKIRIEAWKKELNPIFIYIIQSLASKSLILNKYKLQHVDLNLFHKFNLLLFFIRFISQPIKFYVVLKDFFKLRYHSFFQMKDVR